MENDARRAAEVAARVAYGRMVAWLAARSRNLAAAEDALAEAFRTALETWPVRGIPDRPEAWLVTAARRHLGHGWRHERVRADSVPTLVLLAEEAAEDTPDQLGDERLKLLFVCAHPAIDEAVRAPLMLQTVLGLDAVRIARAFLVAPAALGQRLVRAKAKIRDAGIRFEVPGRDELEPRLEAVLEAIYAAYGSGWDDVAGADPKRRDLADEGLHLGRIAASLLPDEPESRGLLALMLYCEARRPARRDAAGGFVPLERQDAALWSRDLIVDAEAELTRARAANRIGRFQLEAAIQSVHAQRAVTGRTEWRAVALLYEGLVRLSPTAGALVGRAAAVAECHGPVAGLAMLETIPAELVDGYQPFWALRAHLLATLDRNDEAAIAYYRAADLSDDPAVRAFLDERRAGLV
ncbi:MAG: DUF6596 domain-containing protein [Geminicoccaceae bacterium]